MKWFDKIIKLNVSFGANEYPVSGNRLRQIAQSIHQHYGTDCRTARKDQSLLRALYAQNSLRRVYSPCV